MGKWIEGMSKDDWQQFSFWKTILFGEGVNRVFIYIIFAFWAIGFLLGKIEFTLENLDKLFLYSMTSIFIPTLTGLIRYFSTYEEPLKRLQNYYSIITLFERSVPNLQSLLQDTIKLGVIKSTFDKLPAEFGGIVIGADEKEYLEKLNNLIPSAETFYATLRGGQHPRYTIGWFFEDSVLKRDDKIRYLQAINAKLIDPDKKIRIIILEEEEMADFYNDSWRDTFFDYSYKVTTYLISPNALKEKLRDMGISQTFFIMEDYAIFGKIAIKHNGQNSLYLGAEQQIDIMRKPFELANNDKELRIFKKINKDGLTYYDSEIGRKNQTKIWREWKQSFITNYPRELLETIIKNYQSKDTIHKARYSNFCTEDEFKNLVVRIYGQMFPQQVSSTFSSNLLKQVYNKIFESNRDLNKDNVRGLHRLEIDEILKD